MFAKNQLKLALLFALAIFIPRLSFGQCAAVVDLNTWTPSAQASAGNWVVNAAGTSVTQTINGAPAFFVSPQEFINVRITGTFRTTGTDDDFIGFVFGWQDPIFLGGNTYTMDGYLFDWSKIPHASPSPGQYLSRLDGNISYGNPYWWQHTPNSPELFSMGFNPVGWVQNASYNFELTYLTDRITIRINGATIFDVTGCFQPGKFGFYNYSQASVIYSNFAYEIFPDISVASSNVCLSDSAQFFYINDSCSSANGASSTISSFNWDFGDGNTSSAVNPAHLYSSPGTYNVGLEVVDFLGCRDTVFETVTINALPPTPGTANNGPLCENSTLNLTATSLPGGSYSWTGPNGFSSTQQNPSIASAQDNASGNYQVVVTDANGCSSTAGVTAATVYDTPLAPTATNTGPVCQDSALTFNATGQGGATYTWSGPNSFTSTLPNPTIAAPSPAATGTYSVFATINGCPGPASTTSVTINPTPLISVSGTQTICQGQSTTLNATGASSYVWSTSSNANSITVAPTTTTTYSVAGTSAAGCPAPLVPVTVTVDTLPLVNLGVDQVVCDGTTLNAGPNVANYSWNTGASTQTIPVNTSGTYIVTGTDGNNCSSSDTVNVTVNNTILANLGADQNICPGDSVQFIPTNSFVALTWSDGTTGPSIFASTQGNYYVDVVDVNGCTSSDTVFLNVYPTPVVTIAGNQQICIGESTTLTASGANTYGWNNGSTSAGITVAPLVDSTYVVQGTSAVGCPSAPVSVTVIVDSLPAIDLGVDTTVCDGLTLDAGTSASNYSWGGGQTSQTIPVTTSGTYSVTVSNSATCVNADTINVVVNNTVIPDLGADQDICPGDTVVLVSTPNNFAVYNWSTGSGANSIDVTTTGTYVLNTQDVNGCPSTDTVFINVWPLLTGMVGNDTLLCAGDSVTFDASSWAGATYSWSPNGEATPSITTGSQGTYTVVIDDGNGCIYTDSASLTIDVPPTLALATSDTIRCLGDPVTFTVSPATAATYEFFNGGNSVLNGPNASFTTTGLQPGNSLQVVGTTANGCPTAATNSIAVTILDRPTGSSSADTVCVGFPTTLTLNPGPNLTATWTGTGGLSGNSNTISHIYPTAGTYTYSILLENGSCDTTIFGSVEVLAEPLAPTTQDGVACIGEDAQLDISGGSGLLEWYDAPSGGNVVNTGDSIVLAAVTVSDTFYVQEIVTGCVGPRVPIVLEVVDLPTAGFIASPDTSVILNIPQSEVQFVNLSTGANSYAWDFGDGNTSSDISPIYTYTQPGDYIVTLIAITSNDCQDTITLGPFEARDFEGFSAPSGFSPNNDGDNDTWVIDDLFFYPNNKLTIFNRWGDPVFEADRYQNNWDGMYNGDPLPEGTYYYLIDLGDGSELVKGYVVLFR